jgi:hypothetical protein
VPNLENEEHKEQPSSTTKSEDQSTLVIKEHSTEDLAAEPEPPKPTVQLIERGKVFFSLVEIPIGINFRTKSMVPIYRESDTSFVIGRKQFDISAIERIIAEQNRGTFQQNTMFVEKFEVRDLYTKSREIV